MSDGTADTKVEALTSLISPLEEVPEEKFRRVVTMLEGMRHKPEIKAALDGMRPRIVQVRPPRTMTVQRILYMPVEDALVNAPDKDGSGYVSRALMSLAWHFLTRQTDPTLLQEWQRRIGALTGVDSDDELTVQDEIWRWAVELLRHAVDKALTDRGDRKALLGDSLELLGEMQQAIRLIDVAPQIRVVKRMLPQKPVRTLAREDRPPLRHMILDLQPSTVDRIYAILLAVMFRLAVPGEFLDDIPGILSGLPNATKAELQGRLTVFVMGDMDRRAAVAVQANEGDLNLRAKKAEILVAALSAGEKTIMTGDRDTRKQLTAVRSTAERLVSAIVVEAGHSVQGGIAAGSGATVAVLKRAEDSVTALRQCGSFADKIGLEATVKGTIDKVRTEMRQRAATALETMARDVAGGTDPGSHSDEIFWTIRMLELAGNADEADNIRLAAMKFLLPTQSMDLGLRP
jgi:hypothetical protein